MSKQTFTVGQVLTAAQMTSLQQTAMGGGSTTDKVASYVLVAADAGTVVQMNAAGATTITVNTALFAAGDTVQIQNIGAGVCTVTAGTATVSTAGSLALSQYEGGQLYFNTTSAALFFDIVQSSGMTNPMTTTGDIIYSSSGSTPARLGIGTTGQVVTVASGLPSWATPSGGFTAAGTAVYLHTTASIPNGTDTFIGWDVETFDTDGYHSTASNTDRFTVPAGKAGKYLMNIAVQFANNSTGTRSLSVAKNGATGGSRLAIVSWPALSGEISLTISFVVNAAVADYYGFYVYQNSGGALNINGNASNTMATTASFMYLGA